MDPIILYQSTVNSLYYPAKTGKLLMLMPSYALTKNITIPVFTYCTRNIFNMLLKISFVFVCEDSYCEMSI